ncbi:DUF4259 domain-containing protein [Streptomyces halobius]|uniref:DUF4259 domain-containing protein n=1 Tax=Streptomyces halobius TaxID=2879846 RepID=UPI0029E8237F|nr:DUF4259 domain-containing protein [Streptomyces halobius]
MGSAATPRRISRGDLDDLADGALERVPAPDPELAELWDDSPSGPQWRASVDALRTALRPASESV